MYLAHWNLADPPFQNIADPRFAYLSDQHQEGLARLIYLVKSRKLGGALIGAYGVGKSMILELLARSDLDGSRFAQFDTPPGGAEGLIRQILTAVGVEPAADTPTAALAALRAAATQARGGFTHTTLAIDEAQMIRDTESVELLHRLTNFRVPGGANRPDQPAFTLILSGYLAPDHPALQDRALRQRLTTIWTLAPLDAAQTAEYVALRMRAAGGDIWVFEDDAIAALAGASGGIPRLINNICDVALMNGFSLKAPRITRELMAQAIAEACPPTGDRAPLTAPHA